MICQDVCEDKKVVLVEGPKFYGAWLLAAANANKLLREARTKDFFRRRPLV